MFAPQGRSVDWVFLEVHAEGEFQDLCVCMCVCACVGGVLLVCGPNKAFMTLWHRDTCEHTHTHPLMTHVNTNTQHTHAHTHIRS